MVIEEVETIVDVISELNTHADELQTIDDDLAQEVASVLYKGVDSIKHGLVEVLEEEHLDNLVEKLNNKINPAII